jgi:hypothetical protein
MGCYWIVSPLIIFNHNASLILNKFNLYHILNIQIRLQNKITQHDSLQIHFICWYINKKYSIYSMCQCLSIIYNDK